MKLLIVSHACIIPVNQAFYAELESITGWDVAIIVPSFWNSEYRADVPVSRWPAFKGKLIALPVLKSGNIPLHVYKNALLGILRRERPDAIFVHHEPYGLATAQIYLANRLTRNVPIGFYSAQNILKKYPLPIRLLERMVLRSAAFGSPVSEGVLNVLRLKGFRGNAEIFPLAVDALMYYPRTEWAKSKRKELGIAHDEFVLGYMGRLVEEKGLKTTLLAARALQGLRWRFILVGSGPLEAEMRLLVAELGIQDQVLFAGFVSHEEAPGWLSIFDVLVLASESRPNWKEQFGRVLVEANACGTAVIGTESGEIGNVLRSTGGGLIVPEANPEALGSAMRELAEHPERVQELALQGAAAVKEKYGLAYLAKRFAALVERCVKTPGG